MTQNWIGPTWATLKDPKFVPPLPGDVLRLLGNLETYLIGGLQFYLRGMAQVANEATEVARNIVGLRERHRAILVDRLGRGAGNGLTLLESLYRRPIFAVSDVAELLGLSNAAANTLTGRLLEYGIVGEITGNRRNRLFRYDPYIALFD